MDAVVQRLTATEVSVGDIRMTLTAQAQHGDSVRAMMEQINARLEQVMAGHDRLHQEIAELRGRGPAGPGARTRINPKDLKLQILGDGPSSCFRQQWGEWADKSKDYLSLRLPEVANLRARLTALESKKDPMSPEEITDFNLDDGSAAELRFFFKNFTTAYPYDQISALGDQSPLEMWRVLAQSCDPMSHEGNFTDSQSLHSPSRCKSLEALPGQIASWKKQLERWSARTKEKLAPSTQKEALIRLCPEDLELDIRKNAEKLDSFEKIERYILFMVNHEVEQKRRQRYLWHSVASETTKISGWRTREAKEFRIF